MKKKIITTTLLIVLILGSCKNSESKVNTDTTSEKIEKTSDEIIISSVTDKDGKKLDLSFNNTLNTATLTFEGETINLEGQKPASGIWYKNDHYELRGKGNDIELTKDGKIIFKN